jgi:hypothetical protein
MVTPARSLANALLNAYTETHYAKQLFRYHTDNK